MKLSKETIDVLKNFSTINAGMQFKEGKVLSTVAPSKTVLAKATVPDEFPQDFCVFDLNEFLSVNNLMPDTELEFDESNIIFRGGRSKIKYRKTAVEMICVPPAKELTLPTKDVEFKLPLEVFNQIMKVSSVLSSPHIAVESDGDKVSITTFDASNDSAHTNITELANGTGKKYRVVFKAENFKMLPRDYQVTISFKGLAKFEGPNIEYWVAIEPKESKFS